MKAVVLAAGEGTRMRPLTATRPKPMLPVAGKPLVEHVLDIAAEHVDGYVLVVGYRADSIRSHLGDEHLGKPITYVEQTEQRGTAHAIEEAGPHISERFLALNGDVMIDDGLVAKLADAETSAIATMRVDDPTAYGVISRDGDRVTGIVEKPSDPPSNLANLGLYSFEPEIFEYIDRTGRSERGEYEITDSIELAIEDSRPVVAVEHGGRWLDVGRPWELLDANERLLDTLSRRIHGTVEDGATIQGEVIVEEGACVRSGAYVEGAVLIQSGADVGPNAYVRGATVVGRNARVGNGVEIKNSILLDDASVGHLSYVGDSVIGADANLGAGTIVANLRHDNKPVQMAVKGEQVDTGRRKLGVVLADGVKTGINTSLNAGTKLGVGAMTRPGEAVMSDRGDGL
ncbi:bifunctional sugar-1-phosphate nucleotidylyltransferase/acetyltransferase [Natranaeroarchaeum sulfidigenes]|uniref:Bifunctional protein GlmU n=1 Tax=Natranaeroarchaeum sulfidigenes TaxID=2784880 RepID=A0A897MNW2_9EURY|nr:bifunctional sugar-1-phosphate nucleotidylyltransferase/acetyltransferase [Natranaeroarchaeum sulfidigenes]QSG02072.1 N-acetylglucosamine-1-phosphate uridyltransferase [Natranaeroarchaeum sulfidigenes]